MTDSSEISQHSLDDLFKDVKNRAHDGDSFFDRFRDSKSVAGDAAALIDPTKGKVGRFIAATTLAIHALQIAHDHREDHKGLDDALKSAKSSTKEFFGKCKDHPEYADIVSDVIKDVREGNDTLLSAHDEMSHDKHLQRDVDVSWAKNVDRCMKQGLEAIELRNRQKRALAIFKASRAKKPLVSIKRLPSKRLSCNSGEEPNASSRCGVT